jgi:hypothetical protein
MKKRFIIAVNITTPESEKALTEFFTNYGLGWWHWITNVWLVSDPNGRLTTSEIVDGIVRILPGIRNLVIELGIDGSDAWSGVGPKEEKNNMFKWIQEQWNK